MKQGWIWFNNSLPHFTISLKITMCISKSEHGPFYNYSLINLVQIRVLEIYLAQTQPFRFFLYKTNKKEKI